MQSHILMPHAICSQTNSYDYPHIHLSSRGYSYHNEFSGGEHTNMTWAVINTCSASLSPRLPPPPWPQVFPISNHLCLPCLQGRKSNAFGHSHAIHTLNFCIYMSPFHCLGPSMSALSQSYDSPRWMAIGAPQIWNRRSVWRERTAGGVCRLNLNGSNSSGLSLDSYRSSLEWGVDLLSQRFRKNGLHTQDAIEGKFPIISRDFIW